MTSLQQSADHHIPQKTVYADALLRILNFNNAWQHQANTLADAALSSVEFSVSHLRAISFEVLMNLIRNMVSDHTFSNKYFIALLAA